ncbi:hypothetical protein LPB140_06905 [Sphingorhabdus lutea]|uniref:Uncharacterized protein n=1 Tax=Sphingorhabdus lutea TaxID=1913578 RepID=A0A1L3JBN7_9SPHN|nr:PC4/YdbC family ssDNA-binding protein [Sphingorhabdus lutea]APG62557.1 hypothetical protein LPB140_06905 [Sphingorhabdus lutea]
MSDNCHILWEQRHNKSLLRFSVRKYHGRWFAELRSFYETPDGWQHSPKGCTMPISGIEGLGAALMAYAKDSELIGPENGLK